jgi:hypothetical protein
MPLKSGILFNGSVAILKSPGKKPAPRAVASCRNCLAVSLADKRQAVAKDAMLATRKRSSIEPWMLTGADLRIVKLSRWLRPAKIRWMALDRDDADSPIASYIFLNDVNRGLASRISSR